MKKQTKTIWPLVILVLFGFVLGANRDSLKNLLVNPLTFLAQNQKNTVAVAQLKQMLKNKNFVFINVHTPYEGEIEKTDTFLPYDQIVANSSNLPKDKNTAIVLYCRSGRMSAEALETVKKLGYTNVKHLAGGMDAWQKSGGKLLDLSNVESAVLPKNGIELSIAWGDLGPKLIALGVIDPVRFKQAVKSTPEQEEILSRGSDKKIKIDAGSSQFVVDLLWAIGLAQKSIVYEQGPMGTQYKKDAGNFASTGGWTLARGNAMNYLNRFDLISLTSAQQQKVAAIAKNVYRPCCGNSTWFPDCNHGMAALALIELMVAGNVDETIIYRKVLGFNSFWFPDSYLYAATYFARQGTSWDKVDAKEVLGKDYSSAQGARAVAQKVGTLPFKRENASGACGA